MGLFGKSKAQLEAEEAEAKRLHDEEVARKVAAQEAEKKRVIEETKKAMEAKKQERMSRAAGDGEADERKSRVDEQNKKNPLGKSHVSRAGVDKGESDDINAQIRLKMQKMKEKDEQKRKEAEEKKEKARQAAIARGETPAEPTVGAVKWGQLAMRRMSGGAAQMGGGLMARLKALKEAEEAERRANSGEDEEQKPDPLTLGINRPLPEPGHTVTLAEKTAARSAASAACGLFLTYEEKVNLDERVNRLNRKIKELEEKIEKMKKDQPTMAGKVRRMSAAMLGGAAPKPAATAKPTAAVDPLASAQDASAGDSDPQAAALAAYAAGLEKEGGGSPDKPKKGKMRRLSAAIFGGGVAPTSQPTPTANV